LCLAGFALTLYIWKLRLNLSLLGQVSFSTYTSEIITPALLILLRKPKAMELKLQTLFFY
jgi:hypothetical protein